MIQIHTAIPGFNKYPNYTQSILEMYVDTKPANKVSKITI